ncbi:MAG: hypothetical protein NT003_00135, partial [Candidatus Magasanikbacteria bacterium]|nr:hypothetical protein [Candidatus Magasanikbacteria bacterium]
DISLLSKLKANVGVTRVPSTGLVNFAFRAADSKWGFMLVYGVGDVRPQVCFFLHLGRDCLLPLAPNGPSVFETARVWCVNAGIEIDRVELIADGGIGSCCYAFPNVDALSKRVSDRYGDDACEEVFLRDKKVNPPNAGGIAISLNNLVDLEFARAFEGIRIIDSNLGNFCTACYGHGADHDVTKRLLSSSARGDGLRRDLIVASFDFSGMEFLET